MQIFPVIIRVRLQIYHRDNIDNDITGIQLNSICCLLMLWLLDDTWRLHLQSPIILILSRRYETYSIFSKINNLWYVSNRVNNWCPSPRMLLWNRITIKNIICTRYEKNREIWSDFLTDSASKETKTFLRKTFQHLRRTIFRWNHLLFFHYSIQFFSRLRYIINGKMIHITSIIITVFLVEMIIQIFSCDLKIQYELYNTYI